MNGMRVVVGRPATSVRTEPDSIAAGRPDGSRLARRRSDSAARAGPSLRVIAALHGRLEASVRCRSTPHSVSLGAGDLLVLADDAHLLGTAHASTTRALLIDLAFVDEDVAPCQADRPVALLNPAFSGPAVAYRFVVDDETAAEFRRALRIGNGRAHDIPDAQRILTRIDHEQRQIDTLSSCAVAACTIELVVLIAREAATVEVRSEVMEAVETYLLQNTNRRVTLEELAGVSGLNPSYLSRRYREVYGESPIAHHTRLRLERAAHLIDDGRGVTATATECGFRTVYHFSNTFKKHYGVAPSDYRHRGSS